jgi:predicted permease
VLAALGGVAAIILSLWSTDLLRATLLPDVTWASRPLEPRILVITSSITLVTAILAGVIPALRVGRSDLTPALKVGERTHGAISHNFIRQSLLVVQGGLSLILLVGAGLFARSVENLRAVDVGIDTDAILADVDLESAGYKSADIAAFYERAADAVRGLPSVERVSLAAAVPFGTAHGGSISIPGRDSLPRIATGGPYVYIVSHGYFATVGTTIVRGREFLDTDRAGTPPVIVINETMARTYWPNEDPLGRCAVISSGACAEIVGIAENARRFQIQEEPSLLFYVPLAQAEGHHAAAGRTVVIRARGEPSTTIRDVRSSIQALAPDLPFVSVARLHEWIDPQLRPWRLGAVLFSTFGVIALLVGATGLYGVINFGVLQRRAEFAIRNALGERRLALVRSVLGEAMRYTTIAIALGIAASIALGNVVAALLFDVSPYDLAVYSIATLVLLAVALVAAGVPALRATRVNPADALRTE